MKYTDEKLEELTREEEELLDKEKRRKGLDPEKAVWKEEITEKTDAIWEQVKGNWKQFKGSIKENWNKLTDDDIEAMEGRRERIIGKIQERYGESTYKANEIERELRNLDRK